MVQLRKRLPSLTALLTLEAVLRKKSFTLAAGDLGVTQAAVSRQIAALEKELGQPLFLRKHRGIEPTAACLMLGSSLAQSFANIADTVDALKSSGRDVVTIGATVAFSSLWLLPRINEFRRLNPTVQLRIVSQDTRFDLSEGDVDLAIRYGIPPFVDAIVIASRGDVVFPVCSPEYCQRRGGYGILTSADDYIEAEVTDRSWHTWSHWLNETDTDLIVSVSLRFSHYTEAISAACGGQGVALGWGVLVKTYLENGSLLRLGDRELIAEGTYNLVLPLKARRKPSVERVAAWLTKALQT
jgi:LysR family transcriptional regulator, glycine cleavage system transcriptional activator